MTILPHPNIISPVGARGSSATSPVSKVLVGLPRIIAHHFSANGVILLGSLFLISMGTAALCAWLFHWRAYLRFFPEAPSITCDSAVGLILAALAFLAASREAVRLSRMFGLSLLIFGGVYLAAAPQHIPFTLHVFFPDVTAAIIFPLPIEHMKMGGTTALVFVLLGILFILLSSTRQSRIRLNVAMILTSAVPSLSLLGMLTCVTGTANQHTWISSVAKMSVPTAMSICVAGVSMGALYWARTDETGRSFQTATASFTLAGLMLLFVGVGFLVTTNADIEAESRRDIVASSRQIRLIQNILDSVRRSETGQRGFLLTGSQEYLRDYESGLRTVTAALQTLHSFRYSDHQADVLRTLINQKLAELASTISMGRNNMREDALATVNSRQGLLLMDQIDAESTRLVRFLDADLAQRQELHGDILQSTRETSVFSYAIAFLMISLGLIVLRAEIVRRVRIEVELRKQAAQVEAVNKELEEFVYVASHDLKAPLRVIDNASKWLEEDLEQHLTEETRGNLLLMRSRVKRMEKLLDDLLQYARIGKVTDDRYGEIVSGESLMGDVSALLSTPDFPVNVDPAFSSIQVCRMPLQHILMNLVSNAIKHHNKKTGCIEITVDNKGDYYSFAVKDDGPGIPEQFHDQIFKMFQTLRPRDKVEGSGMGLAMVRKNIEVFGGALQLESAVGQGSIFRFTWPKQQHKFQRIAA